MTSQVQESQYMGLINFKLSKNSPLFPYSELEEKTDSFPIFWANMHQFFFYIYPRFCALFDY